ncbi:acyltransferase family protein [Sphingomonas hankookensis]|uniref:acyltransferase family protein n=1 Tax=Sphingomonas hankookensis TaxID=563996 RepID=UPI001F55E34F|nr:acyltransferase [Sphingomonas hankookensis]
MTDKVATAANERPRARLVDIDVAKGLGMLLVVFGHLVQTNSPGETQGYAVLRDAIYTFHMPFFMYLSGFVFFLTNGHEALARGYRRFVVARFDRLMLPFLAFGFLVIVGKYYASRIGEVHDGVSSFSQGVMDVLTNAPDNPSISIWYLVVLFSYCIITPLLWRAVGRKAGLLLVVAAAMIAIAYLGPVTERFYLARILRFFLFFAVGGVAALRRDHYYPLLRRIAWPCLALLVVLIVFFGRTHYALVFCGLLSAPALHGIVLTPAITRSTLLRWVGDNSMAIYLMNTIFIGVAKLVWLKVLPVQGGWNPAFLVALMTAGVAGPVVVRMVVQRITGIRFFARYLA